MHRSLWTALPMTLPGLLSRQAMPRDLRPGLLRLGMDTLMSGNRTGRRDSPLPVIQTLSRGPGPDNGTLIAAVQIAGSDGEAPLELRAWSHAGP